LLTIKSSGRVARESERQAQASERSVKAQQEALAASIRPILTSVPQDHVANIEAIEAEAFVPLLDRHVTVVEDIDANQKRRIRITVPIRNVGPGPAVLKGASVAGKGGELSPVLPADILPSGESTYVWAEGEAGEPQFAVLEAVIATRFTVRVTYTDADEGQNTQTTIRIGALRGKTYYAPVGCEIGVVEG
jgi:hypothetical protein